MRTPRNHNLTTLLLLGALIVLVVIYIFPSKTTMAGSHTMYRVRNSTEIKGEAYFCEKCHPEEVGNLTVLTMGHNRTECICHGYYPNVTNSSRNVNLEHELTKDAYCTNCHAKYNSTGDLMVVYGASGVYVNVTNQSGHYVSNNSEDLMNRTMQYFGLF